MSSSPRPSKPVPPRAGKPSSSRTDYDLFLSHNSRDKAHVEVLAEELLEAHGVNCWVDVWAIPAAADWRSAIDSALDSCGAALIALSTEGFGPVHAAEATQAIERGGARHFTVIPLVFAAAAQTVQDVLEAARSRSPANSELGALLELFESKNCIRLPVDLDDPQRPAALSKVVSALGHAAEPPHPLGPDILTPIRIRRDARLWLGSGRKADHLYGEDKARLATQQRLRSPGQLDATALAFLDACVEHHRALGRRRTRTLTVAAGVLAVLLTAAGVAAFLAYRARQDSERALRAALGRNASLLAQAGDEGRALVDGSRAVLPSFSGEELSNEGLQGLWRAVSAARASFLLEGTCSPNSAPSLSADGAVAFYLTRSGIPTSVETDWYERREFDIGKRSASAVAMSSDGARFWIGTSAGELLRAGANGSLASLVAKPCGTRITAVADAPPGEAVVACQDRDLVTYAVHALGVREVARRRTIGPGLAIASNPRHLLVVSAPQSEVLDRPAGTDAKSLVQPILLAGAINHYDQVIGVSVDRTVFRCELRAGGCVPLPPAQFPDASFETVAFAREGEWIVGGDGVGRFIVWGARGGQFRALRATTHAFPLAQLALSADGRRALSVDTSGACRAWRADDDTARAILGRVQVDGLQPPWLPTARLGSRRSHFREASVVAVSAAGEEPMSLHADGSVQLWRGKAPSLRWRVPTVGFDERACLGPRAAGVVRAGKLVVANASGTLSGSWTALAALSCRIEDQTLQVTGLDGFDHFYDLASGRPVERTSERAPARIPAAMAGAAPPTGLSDPGASWWRLPGTARRLFVTSDAHLWLQVESGWVELEHRKLEAQIVFASSPDHRLLAAGNGLGELWVWRVDDGGTVIQLEGSSERITSLDWTASGDLIAGSLDGSVRVYSASARKLAREACRLVNAEARDVNEMCRKLRSSL